MKPKIKICGVTNPEDAFAAVEAGADALGFMFYEGSPRKISFSDAASIIRRLPPFVTKVGVFVNAPVEQVRRAIAECGLDAIQLHGDETPEFCALFSAPVIKAFRIRDADSLSALPSYRAAAWLLDSCVPGKLGGTGVVFNWQLAVQAKNHGTPIILAGGLSAENVAEAVSVVQPYAVDVSSGVESTPGRKDCQKMREFICAARR